MLLHTNLVWFHPISRTRARGISAAIPCKNSISWAKTTTAHWRPISIRIPKYKRESTFGSAQYNHTTAPLWLEERIFENLDFSDFSMAVLPIPATWSRCIGILAQRWPVLLVTLTNELSMRNSNLSLTL